MKPCRFFLFAVVMSMILSACAPPQVPIALDGNGQPLPVLYRVDPGSLPMIRARVLDRVNAARIVNGLAPLRLDDALNMAAMAQSGSAAASGRLSHIGPGASSPVERAQAAGYRGAVLGETLAQTYAAELATVAEWIQAPDTNAVILDPQGRDMGLGYHQDEGGQIWWTFLLGAPAAAAAAGQDG